MGDRRKYVSGVAYDATSPEFVYPETAVTAYNGKLRKGLCFSGGGTRAATLAAGQLRALRALERLDDYGYVSCVSGGSWAVVPYVYLDHGIPDDIFLGELLQPDQITMECLKIEDESTLTYSSSHSVLADDLYKTVFAGDERYSDLIGGTFLKPYNIGSERRFFSLDGQSVNKILERNPHLTASDFYLTNRNAYRPYLIANGTILRPNYHRYHFEMTPLYVGTSEYFPGAGSGGAFDIGGGYVEPHMFDSDSPSSTSGGVHKVRLGRERHMFTLSDVIGTSGAAPAEYADRWGLEVGFPEFKYWSPKHPDRAKEYDFGDGGILENLGIMPLLKRGVDRIVAFVNCKSNITYGEVASSITALFKPLPNKYGSGTFDKNVVLDNRNNQYESLAQTISEIASLGDGVVHTDTYHVIPQPHYGVAGEFDAEITWVVNAIARNWVNDLPIEVRRRLDAGEYGRHFPHLATFFENFPKVIDLGVEQANLMAHHAAWIVEKHGSHF